MQERLRDESRDPSKEVAPSSNYKDKYHHLIGTSAAKDAAKKTEANKSFGMGEDQKTKFLCDFISQIFIILAVLRRNE